MFRDNVYLWFVCLIGAVLTALQFLNFKHTNQIEFFSLISEAFVMFLCLYCIYEVQKIKTINVGYIPLVTGFTALFVSFLTDTLDEVLQQPAVLTVLFEDIFQMVGFIFILLGLKSVIKGYLSKVYE